jgi:glutamate racemase
MEIVEPHCKTCANMNVLNQLNNQLIADTIQTCCDRGADVIILGCTHYHWIKEDIIALTRGRAQVIEPSEAIGRRVRTLLTPV